MLSYLQIFLQISLQILKLIVRRKILAYKARFEIKETRIGKKHMCKKKLFLRVMRLPDNERDNLYEKKKKKIELLLSAGDPSASLKEVCGTGGLLPHCVTERNSRISPG